MKTPLPNKPMFERVTLKHRDPERKVGRFTGVRLPITLQARVDGYAKERQLSRSEAIRVLLEKALAP